MKSGWAAVILIAAGIAAYANTAKNGLFWDDDEFITRNAYVRSFRYLPQWFSRPLTAGAGVNSNYWRPLLQLSFAIDYKLWGLWPAGYHLENMLWHTFAAVLLFIFLNGVIERLLKIKNQKSKIKNNWEPSITSHQSSIISFAASLLWLIHPVHVEAVAYANSRGDSMATAFVLLTLILWMKRQFWASAAAFVLALLSKEFAIITPGLIVLVEFIKESPWRTPRTLLSKMLPHVVIFFIYLLLRLTVLNFQNTLNFYGVDLSRADRSDPMVLYATSLPARLMTFLKVLPIYGRILVWPDDLHMERTVEIAVTIKDPVVLLSLAVILAAAGSFGWALIFSQRKLAGTSEPRSHALRERPANSYAVTGGRREVSVLPGSILIFALAWFFISILPISGIIPISQILAEHFLYLPSIGFFLIAGWLSVILSGAKNPDGIATAAKGGLAMTSNLIYWLILLGISIPLIVKTISQNRVWRDPITFYEYTLARAKPTARVYNNLAMAYADRGDHQKAINNYQLAISLGDVYPNPHYNLGNTLMELGKLAEAEKEYRRALEIDPQFHYATLKLGQMYLDQGKIDAAKKLMCPVFPTQPLCQYYSPTE